MIGKTIWVFDSNFRHYYDSDGNKTSAPDYRAMWRPHKVVDETNRSWILEGWEKRKVPKKPRWPETLSYCFSEEEVDDRVWQEKNAHKIAAMVNDRMDPSILRKVADMIGYKEV